MEWREILTSHFDKTLKNLSKRVKLRNLTADGNVISWCSEFVGFPAWLICAESRVLDWLAELVVIAKNIDDVKF